MVTKFDVGDEVIASIKGRIKRISIEENGICYTVVCDDDLGRYTDLYFNGDQMLRMFQPKHHKDFSAGGNDEDIRKD